MAECGIDTAIRNVIAVGADPSRVAILDNFCWCSSNEPERLAARDQAPEDPPLTRRVRVLALDALVPIVSPDNPVTAISMTDLARAFSGEIDNWAALGGPDAPIALHLLSAFKKGRDGKMDDKQQSDDTAGCANNIFFASVELFKI